MNAQEWRKKHAKCCRFEMTCLSAVLFGQFRFDIFFVIVTKPHPEADARQHLLV